MILILVLSAGFIASCAAQDVDEKQTEEEYLKELKIYYSLPELLSFFKNHPNPLAQQVLNTFLTRCRFNESRGQKRGVLMRPVIAIEGNHRSSRDVVVTGLTEMMHARYITHPAPCIHKYHALLPRGSLLRRAYYLLSNYAGALYAMSQINKPIIINGYWTEQLAFTITHHFGSGKLPPVTDDIFKFPEDLLQPDLIFYLNFPDNLIHKHVTTKSPLIWKPRMLEAYRHMSARHPIIMKDVRPLFKLTTEEIHRYIHDHFYNQVFGIRNHTGTVPKQYKKSNKLI